MAILGLLRVVCRVYPVYLSLNTRKRPLRHMHGRQESPLPMAGRTRTPLPARIGYKHRVLEVRTAHSGVCFVEVPRSIRVAEETQTYKVIDDPPRIWIPSSSDICASCFGIGQTRSGYCRVKQDNKECRNDAEEWNSPCVRCGDRAAIECGLWG